MEAKKSIKPLGQRQLMTMKRKGLEGKVISYYEATHDVNSVVEYLVVILLRDALILQDFSFMCIDLVRQLFMTAEPNDTLRKFCAYFESFFTVDEWKEQVKDRLFKNEAAYLKVTEEARRYSKLLNTPGTGKIVRPDHKHDIVAVFEDANGKKHRLTIRDTYENLTQAESAQRLEILTTLTILKSTKGERRFVNFIDLDRTGKINTYDKEPVEDTQEESVKISSNVSEVEEFVEETIEIVAPEGIDIDALALDEEQLLALVQAVHPNIRSLKNIRVVFTEEKPEDQAPPEEEIPISDKRTQKNSDVQETASTKKESSSTAVADPPPSEIKLTKPRNMREFIKFRLIKEKITGAYKNNGKSKNGNNGKKDDDHTIFY